MSPTLVAVLLGGLAIVGSLGLALFLLIRYERRLDAQVSSELDKLRSLVQALTSPDDEVTFTEDDFKPKLDPNDPDVSVLDSIILDSKKKPN